MHRFKRSRVAEIRNQEADRTADLFGKPHMRMILDNSCFKLRTFKVLERSTTQTEHTTVGTSWLVELVAYDIDMQFFQLALGEAWWSHRTERPWKEWKNNVKEGHGRHTFDDGKVYDGFASQ